MRSCKLAATALILAFVALVYQSANGLAQNQADLIHAVRLWEYKTVELPLGGAPEQEKALNELGVKGWELVTITAYQTVPGGGSIYHATLKKPKAM
jgi:hypothetical protein